MAKRPHDTLSDAECGQEDIARKTRIPPSIAVSLTCSACAEDIRISDFPEVKHECSNTVCRSCWDEYLATKLEQKPTTDIECTDCDVGLTEADFKDLATKETYERFLDKSMKEFLAQDPNYRECPSASCSYGYILSQDDLQSDAIFNCHVCNAKYCTRCEVPMHSGETCKEYIVRIEKQDSVKRQQEKASEDFLKTYSKPCPKCTVQIRKVGGCDHMTCRQCKHEFCYVCSAPYDGPRGIREIGNGAHNRSCPFHPNRLPSLEREEEFDDLAGQSDAEVDSDGEEVPAPRAPALATVMHAPAEMRPRNAREPSVEENIAPVRRPAQVARQRQRELTPPRPQPQYAFAIARTRERARPRPVVRQRSPSPPQFRAPRQYATPQQYGSRRHFEADKEYDFEPEQADEEDNEVWPRYASEEGQETQRALTMELEEELELDQEAEADFGLQEDFSYA